MLYDTFLAVSWHTADTLEITDGKEKAVTVDVCCTCLENCKGTKLCPQF